MMDKMLNVLFVEYCKDLKAGGAQRVFINILNSIESEKINVFAAFPDINGSEIQNQIIGNVKTFHYDSKSPESNKNKILTYLTFGLYIPIIVIRWIYLIRKHNIQVVYVHSVISGLHFCLVKYFLNIKIIYHEHNMASQRPFTMLWRKLFEFVNKNSDLIIAISEDVSKSLTEHGSEQSKIKVIHNGIEILNINKTECSKQGFSRLALKYGDLVVGMVGHFRPWKGQKIFVESLALVAKEIPNIMFVIVGGVHDAEYYQQVMEYINDKNLKSNIVITGHQNNVHELIAAMDIVVVPSVPEPFGLVVLEGMMMSKPVISFNIGGPAEIIRHNITGYLVDKVDSTNLANAILYLTNEKELREKIGKAGRVQLEKEYSHLLQGKRVTDEIINLLSNT